MSDHRGNEQRQYLDTGRHGDVEVAQHVLRVLVLGGLAQEGQEPGGFLIAVSHLMSQGKWRGRNRWREENRMKDREMKRGSNKNKREGEINKGRKREVEKERD